MRQPTGQRAADPVRPECRLPSVSPDPEAREQRSAARCSSSRSPAAARAPRRSPTACWKSFGGTEIAVDGQRRRLIDEVDIITGVSGGSFTALAYALHGERLFSEYEQRFLKRDVQGDLVARALNPFNWWKYIGGTRRALGARRGLLRRDPVRRRDVRATSSPSRRRSRSPTAPTSPPVRGCPSTRTTSTCCARTSPRCACRARRPHRLPCRSCCRR